MNKKFLSIIIICGVILSLTACGQTAAKLPEDIGSTATDMTSSDTSVISTAEPDISSQAPTPESSETQTTPPAVESKSTSSTANSKTGSTSSKAATSTASSTPSQAPAQSSTAPSSTVIEKDALPADNTAIANKMIDIINEYRVAQGVGKVSKLPGLTQVAQYRSNQLVTNYRHNLDDMREATRAFHYGEHIVYEEYGLDYYESHAGEAIGRSGGNAPIDEIAARMAKGFKDSASHWAYVGAARTKYIAIGLTYGNGQWYVCVLTSETNIYG